MSTSAPLQDSRPASLLPPQGWRGLARLALEGLAAGIFVSFVLALAVFIVASRADAAPLRAQGLAADDAHGGVLKLSATGDEPAMSAPLVATEVRIEVAGIVARTMLTQRFVNPTPVWREGVYLFPLPDKAAVDHMRVETGGRVIEGEVHERAKAKQAYDDAKRTGRQAGLVEQERPNLFTTSVALLPPDEEVVVTIEYQETLRYDTGTFSLRLPLAVTPRYMPLDKLASLEDAEDAERVSMPFHLDETRAPVTVEVSLDAGFPLAIVESFDHATEHNERLTVEDAMVIFKSCLDDEKRCNELDADLPGLSLALAHSCRESLGRSWGYEVSSWWATISSLRWRIKRGCWRRARTRSSPSRRAASGKAARRKPRAEL